MIGYASAALENGLHVNVKLNETIMMQIVENNLFRLIT